MSVAIGPVFLLLATVLLGAVLLLAVFGFIVWLNHRHRQAQGRSEGRTWEHDSTEIASQGGTSIVVSGK